MPEQPYNPTDVFSEQRSLMTSIVEDAKSLRDHLSQRLYEFNQPVTSDNENEHYYNPSVFLRSDSLEAQGVFLFQPIGGRAGYGMGSNHQAVSDLWDNLVKQTQDIYSRVFSIYRNFFEVTGTEHLTEAHFKMLDKDIASLDKDLSKKIEGLMSDMESFLKRIPHPEDYSNYYLFGFGKPWVERTLARMRHNMDRLVFELEPFLYSQTESNKIESELAKLRMEESGNTSPVVTNTKGILHQEAHTGIPLAEGGMPLST